MITGRPSSGKSTFAKALRERLSSGPCCVLDGDDVRQALAPRPGYGDVERENFYRTLAGLAGLMARQGLDVLVAATATQERLREFFRAQCKTDTVRYIEVFIATPAEEAARRDTKGLYKQQAEGRIKNLPGADAPYEVPEKPDVTARDGLDQQALDAVVKLLQG